MTVESRKSFIINIIFFAIIIALSYLALKYLLIWILPFIIAFIISSVIQKPIIWLSKKTKLKRRLCAVIVSVATILLVIGSAASISYLIITELIDFLKTVPGMISNVLPQLESTLNSYSNSFLSFLPNSAEQWFFDLTEQFSAQLSSIIGNAATSLTGWLANIASNLPSVFVSFLVTVIATVFLSMDYRLVVDFIMRQFPQKFRSIISTAKEIFFTTVLKFAKAYIILMLITFVELLILLGITNLITGSVPYLTVVCMLIAVVDILPILGTGTVLIPWSIISLILGDWKTAICIALTYIIITVIRNFLEPKIIGESIGLHPIVTLFCMYFGLKVLGFVGLIGIPLIVITIIKIQESGKIKVFK